MTRVFRMAIAVILAASPAAATVYFENTGTTTGWSYVTREHKGTVTEVASPVFKGTTAVRCVQTYDAAHGDTTLHAELGIRNMGQIGQERYYGWAIRIPSGQSTGGTISQIATDACSSGRQTEMMVITGTGVIDLKTKHGNPCSPATGRYNITSFMTKDVWHRIVIRKLWRDDPSAVTEVWYDGTKVLSRTGISNSITGSALTYRWSIGNYAGFSGTIDGETRSMYVDHARVASTFAEADPAAWPVATVTPTPTPTATPTPTGTPGGAFTEITPAGSAVTASTHDGNLPANTVDNELGTRWSANGDGHWIQYDLGAERTVAHVRVAAFNGNTRQNRFDLQVAVVSGAWTTVRAGAQTSGTTTAEETFDFADVPARWVRYVGHGNTANTFNSVTELSIFAPAGGTPVPPTPIDVTPGGAAVTASTHDGNLPANTVDNDLGTRWSASGDGQWIQYDLGATRTVSHVKLAWYQGDVRRTTFDVLVAGSATGPWTTALAGRQSSGTSLALETHDFADVSGRYLRIVGHGNSVNLWNSLAETEIWGN